jgi:hypothetical protein
MANIHAGEVEGKEAVLVLLREIAEGGHDDLLRGVIVAVIPNYNPDGNDKIDRRNRPDQAGPVEGVGVRHQGRHLDLNRDYVKIEAPETEALIRTVRALDAALVVDLHTTNGSFHGFDLTYAGPLHPATAPAILDYERKTFLPELQARMRKRGFETFDYGNWVEENRPESGWASFEAIPRFGNSYFGLCDRMTLLSEAYSHDPFEKRIRSTYAFVGEALAVVAEQASTIRATLDAARSSSSKLAAEAARLPTGAKLMQTSASHPIPVGGVREEKDPVTGLVRQWDDDVSKPVPMPVFAWFEGIRDRPVPAGWVILSPSDELRRVLDVHGIAYTTLDHPREAKVESFQLEAVKAASRPFQGHRLKEFKGSASVRVETIPKGSLHVPASQATARLVFVLLEAESEDSLGTWDLVGVVKDDTKADRFAALRLVSWSGQ